MPWYSTIKYCIYNITTYHGTATVVAVYYGIYAVLEGTSKNTLLYVQKHITVIIILLSYCQIIWHTTGTEWPHGFYMWNIMVLFYELIIPNV